MKKQETNRNNKKQKFFEKTILKNFLYEEFILVNQSDDPSIVSDNNESGRMRSLSFYCLCLQTEP